MFRVDIPVTIHLRGPFITQSTVPGSYGLDTAAARDSRGRLYIPGTLVAGKLRESWEELHSVMGNSMPYRVPDKKMLHELLGRGSQDDEGSFSPFPKRLHVSDFVLASLEPASSVRYRIEVDQTRGAVKKGALVVIESPFSPSDRPSFSGRVTFLAKSEEYSDKIKGLIQTGLSFIEDMGAFSSVGFGHVEDVKVGRPVLQPLGPEKPPVFDLSSGLDLAILPDGPFCIAKRHTRENNLFVSEEIIPGNVIIGAISRMLHQLGEDGTGSFGSLFKNLSRLRVLHALPSKNCYERPSALPLSLVKAGNNLFDVALMEQPCLIDGKVPAFQVDWKDNTDARKYLGWPELERELRVRTAIDPDSGRSQEERLFAYEMVVPDQETVWLSRVDANRIEEPELREEVLRELSALLSAGLLGLGKTKATARVKVHKGGTIQDTEGTCSQGQIQDAPVVITLKSPALLLCPEGLLDGEDKALDETATHRELFSAYKRAWKELSEELELDYFYASQRLSGGNYQYHRFMKDAGTEEDELYYPWILTEAGSVFVFSITNTEEAERKIESWLENGLPIPETVRGFYGISSNDDEQWKSCPFIAQNGFGEIGVNMEIHWRLSPPEERVQPIMVEIG